MQLEFSLFVYLLSEHISVYQSVYCFSSIFYEFKFIHP